MHSERGIALIQSLIAMTMLMVLGAALVVIAATESLIARNFWNSRQAFYAAEAIVELAVAELRSGMNWTAVLEGAQPSRFVDGAPGRRTLPAGVSLDLTAIENIANCEAPAPCGGVPRWRLFAYGPLPGLLPAAADSPYYAVALVAPATADEGSPAINIRGEAFGPRGAYRGLELTLTEISPGFVRSGAARFVP
jgi:hypothetical protein